jgi:hypothetical protein
LTSVPGKRYLPDAAVYVYPNPCDDRMNVVVNLQQKSEIHIRVTSITGKEVYALAREKTDSGTHILEINRTDFKEQPGSGVYILSVETADGMQHLKVEFR